MLFVVMVLAAWGALGMAQATATAHRAHLVQEGLRVQITLASALDAALDPPDLAVLCLSAPLASMRVARSVPGRGRFELRWRHLGEAIVLAEIDAIGRGGGRVRALAWMTAEQVDRVDGVARCAGARLRPLAASSVVPRPGE
ncbi:MAG: hypothetical protein ACO3HV_05630 [Candidatus Nanopelagicales bacterium]